MPEYINPADAREKAEAEERRDALIQAVIDHPLSEHYVSQWDSVAAIVDFILDLGENES